MVVGADLGRLGTDDSGEQGAGLHVHGMGDERPWRTAVDAFGIVEVLIERPAGDEVEHLHPAADTEDRDAPLERGAGKR